MPNAIKLTIDAADWQKQVNQAVKTLEKLAFNFDKERRNILEYSAIPVVDAMKMGAPVGTKIHVRYSKMQRARARKGEGTRVAKYYPGNLKGAFRILDLKKTEDVIVGAKLQPASGTRGTFGKSRFDAYYLHMIEFGTVYKSARPFVRPAMIRAAPAVVRRVKLACNLFAAKFARQNAG